MRFALIYLLLMGPFVSSRALKLSKTSCVRVPFLLGEGAKEEDQLCYLFGKLNAPRLDLSFFLHYFINPIRNSVCKNLFLFV